MKKRANVFYWVLFALTGLLALKEAFAGNRAGIIIALLTALGGIAKLIEEADYKKMMEHAKRMEKHLDRISDSLASYYSFSKNIKDKNDMRFYRLDRKRRETEKKFERKFRQFEKTISKLQKKTSR